MPNATVKWATLPGERIFIDISSPKVIYIGGQEHWPLCLDDASDCSFSFFMSHKDMLEFKLVPFVKEMKEEFNIAVKIFRCDNAGGNTSFEKACKLEGLITNFDYTVLSTPHHNGRVEQSFKPFMAVLELHC